MNNGLQLQFAINQNIIITFYSKIIGHNLSYLCLDRVTLKIKD